MGLFTFSRKPSRSEADAFRDFYRSTIAPLSRHLQSLGLRSSEELEDVLQSTYLEAHKGFASLRKCETGLAWVMTIGRRQFYAHLANKLQQRKIFVDSLPLNDGMIPDHEDPNIPVLEDHMHSAFLCSALLKMIDAIDDIKKREAIRYYFLEDRSLKEISLELNVKVSTLTTWISRFHVQASHLLRADSESEAEEEFATILAIKEVCP